MNRILTITIVILCALPVQAQIVDRLNYTLTASDSLRKKLQSFASIQRDAAQSYRKLEHQYDSIELRYNSWTTSLQKKLDSLDRINIPSSQLLKKIDSINGVKEAKLTAIKNKVEALKSDAIGKIDSLNLPPELKSKVNEYTGAMNKLDLSMPTSDLQLPPLNFNNNLDLPIPNMKSPLQGSLPNLSTANIPWSEEISKITSPLEGLNQTIPKGIPTVDQLGKAVETQASKIDEISAVQDQMGNLPSVPITSEEQAKQELLKQTQDVAVDHFAGKEQELKSAMDQISTYKKKFNNVNNLEELAALIKKKPNEMNGKPLIERIVPGIAFQIQKKDDLLFVDLNPYVGYRFTGRLTAGIGWNQRVSYNLNDNIFDGEQRIYGPRVYGDYKLWKGFSPRIEVETMNTFVPPYIKVSPADPGQREWVWGVFAGIKKDYKFFKKINGTAQVMFRLFDPQRKSPYADVVNARFGFEFQ